MFSFWLYVILVKENNLLFILKTNFAFLIF